MKIEILPKTSFSESTVGYWLDQFPSDIRNLAMKRMSEDAARTGHSFEQVLARVCDKGDAVNQFTWSDTPEGHTYWSDIARGF